MSSPRKAVERSPHRLAVMAVFALVLLQAPGASQSTAEAGSLKVFVLVGQSNMQGKGDVQQLKALATADETQATYGHWVDAEGGWVSRDDVWIWSLGRKGPLTVGYGSPAEKCFGPELEIGRVLGAAHEAPVLLIKIAWGGKSLAEDFRPPSSGGEVGPCFTETLEHVREVLATREELFPELEAGSHELAGLFWFQGWNDRINQAFNDEYEVNLANLIRDLRTSLGSPALPVVIGETGQGGPDETHPRALSLMQAQAAVAAYEEFSGTVGFVGTRRFYDDEPQHDGGYHFYGNAENFFGIGSAMGQAMLELLDLDEE
jgi:alpha-galactosidase